MEFTIAGHNSLLGDLANLDVWLASMGVPPRSTDRIHRLVRLLTELNPRNVGPALKITREERRLYMYSLAELVEFHQIFTWLNEEDPRVLGRSSFALFLEASTRLRKASPTALDATRCSSYPWPPSGGGQACLLRLVSPICS